MPGIVLRIDGAFGRAGKMDPCGHGLVGFDQKVYTGDISRMLGQHGGNRAAQNGIAGIAIGAGDAALLQRGQGTGRAEQQKDEKKRASA